MSQFKKKLTAFTAMLTFLSISSAATFAVEMSNAVGQTGNINITGGGTRLDVELNSGVRGDVGQVDWNQYNVPGNQYVNYGFSEMYQTIINRVLGGQASNILGKIQSGCVAGGPDCASFAQTGKVILINPAGVIFGNGSQVDLNSFTVSTFDIRGAQNLEKMTKAAKASYQADFLNKLSPYEAISGKAGGYGDITFDSNYKTAFNEAGIKAEQYNNTVELDGATFNNFKQEYDSNTEKSFITDVAKNNNKNKTLAIVSDNIKYKDSLLKVGSNYNYMPKNQDPSSFGKISLITADGATFSYALNGYGSGKAAADTKTDVVRTIAAKAGNTLTNIQSGEIQIENKSAAAGSNINIDKTIIKGTKLVNNASGDILIAGSHDVNITNSRLDSDNTGVTYNNNSKNTKSQTGGRIMITAGEQEGPAGNVNIGNSLLFTASSRTDANDAGDVIVYSHGGNINVTDGSRVLAKGDANLVATKQVTIKDSLVEASNSLDRSIQSDITLKGYQGVILDNATIDSTGDANLLSVASADKATLLNDITIKNGSLVIAEKDLKIRGENTTIDNSDLVYENISFYDANTKGLNDVTVIGGSRFGDLNNGTLTNDVDLITNGNFTLDGAKLQKVATYSLDFNRDADGSLTDNGKLDQIHFTTNVTGANANNVKVTSTQGSVYAKNKTDVNATNDIDLISNTKTVEVIGKSKLTAGHDANVTADKMALVNDGAMNAGHDVNVVATNGNLHIRNNASFTANNDVKLTSHDTITFANQAGDGYIAKSTKVNAGHDINVTSTAGDINSTRQGSADLAYGNRLKFNAAGDNNFSSTDSLKSVNVDYIAGGNNNFVTTDDIQFVNSTLKSKANSINAGSDVILNNLNIVAPDGVVASTVKTNIIAKGDITTVDVTGSFANDTAEATHHFPQVVNVNRAGDTETTLNVNGTKLVAKTQVVKDANDSDNGTITLKVAGTKADAGIELTAENVDATGAHKWDGEIAPKEGPEVHLSSGDGKDVYVSKIVTDKLTLNTGIKAASVELTPEQLEHFKEIGLANPAKGYIEVRDKGGFNQDPTSDFGSDPDAFDYTGHYEISTTEDELENIIDERSQSHTITYGDGSDPTDNFYLVYEKEGNCPQPDYVDPINPVNPTYDSDTVIDSYINQIKLPKEQVEMSKIQRIEDGQVDQSANIMAAAAKITTTEEAVMSEDKDEEENADE